MLKNITAWINAHPETRMDSRAFMACMFDLKINSSDETMFRAAWNLATMPGQVGAATEAVVETVTLAQAAAAADSFVSHVTQYIRHLATVYASQRAAVAVRHDLGRMFSRRFF